MLEARHLDCIRGNQTLFMGLNCTVSRGEILHVQGPNGCGKTTLLRILCGITLAESGLVLWCGKDIRSSRAEFYSELAYVGHNHGIKLELTPRENLRMSMVLSGRDNAAGLAQALDQVGLSGSEDIPCASLSAGQRRRVALGRLYLTPATVWILDEPLSAIDQAGSAEFESLLCRHAGNGGITVLTGHQELSVSGQSITNLSLPA